MAIRSPCGGGSSLPTLCSATAEVWGTTAPYQMGQIVRNRARVSDPWTLYTVTADHAAGGASPSSGAPGYLALTAAPTQIPAWVSGTNYVVAAPVRVDGAGGATRIFVASSPLPSSTNSPVTPAGVADGWVEVVVAAPPPAPAFVPTLAYRAGELVQSPSGSVWVATAPIAINPIAPGTVGADAAWAEIGRSSTVTVSTTTGQQPSAVWPSAVPIEGDLVINRIDGLVWAYAQDPINPTLFVWEQLPTAAPTVTIAIVAGETPILNPPAVSSIGDIYTNRPDGLMWIHAVDPTNPALQVWEAIAPMARGTVTYMADTDPSAPFTLPNNWGFGGTAVVAPVPSVIEPMPNDVWFNHMTGNSGIFS
jgi:hypothetical protein